MPAVPPLVDEATKKSGLVWISVDGGRTAPVWHLWHEGRAYVVTGGSEQPLPGAESALSAVVAVRSKDQQAGRLVEWVADVERVEPGTPTWDEVVPLLHAKRLNAPDGEEQPSRWARECLVLQLTPTGELREPGDGSYAAPPLPTPAATPTRRPFTIGKATKRRSRGDR